MFFERSICVSGLMRKFNGNVVYESGQSHEKVMDGVLQSEESV